MECVSELTIFILTNRAKGDRILIGKDSNYSKKLSHKRISALDNMCDELDLEKVCTENPTFHHYNGSSESNIDYFLVSNSLVSELQSLTSLCTLNTPENLSSHYPVQAIFHVPCTDQTTTESLYSNTYTKFTPQKVIWDTTNLETYQKLAATALTEYDTMFPLLEHIPLKCELFSRILVKSAELCMKVVESKKEPKSKTKVSAKLHQAWQKLRKQYNIWKLGGKRKESSNTEYMEYKRARGTFQKLYRYENELAFIKTNNMIMYADKHNQKAFFKKIKSIRSSKTRDYPLTLSTPVGYYRGADTLEGFHADAEFLGKAVGEAKEYDNDFYRLCILDNYYVFDFKGDKTWQIPEMKIEDIENIIRKDMKLGKACDIYMLTPEHLKYAGRSALEVLLRLLDNIIRDIYYLTCPQVKIGLSTMIYKGKKKPVTESSSYRRITVTPQIGSILDRYIDPMAESLFRGVQSPDQLGFSKGMSYLMGALERGECQRHALDTKQTCFGISFDGKAAFPSVDREIQIRELHSCGESGDLLQYSRNTYRNTVSHIKQDGMIGRQVQ